MHLLFFVRIDGQRTSATDVVNSNKPFSKAIVFDAVHEHANGRELQRKEASSPGLSRPIPILPFSTKITNKKIYRGSNCPEVLCS